MSNTAGKTDTGLTGESLDQVRNILLGTHLRDSERKLAESEKRLTDKTAKLRDDTKRRLDSLRDSLMEELAGIKERVRAERSERSGSDKGLAAAISEVEKALGRKLDQIESRLGKAESELRVAIAEQTELLREELEQAYEEVTEKNDASLDAIRSKMVDRNVLAALLTEVAAKLADKKR